MSGVMAREKLEDKARRAAAILARLEQAMPEARIELDHRTPLELLVAVALSAQTTDKRVNLVTPALFRDFPTAAHYARATPAQLEPYIQSVGLFRTKARNLAALGRALEAAHGGQVPPTRAALAELPGVGLKTAGVVAIHLGTDHAFPVDTHILRLSARMGLSTATDPDGVEADLRRLLPRERWFLGHQLLIWHGRRVCHARSPECHRCVAEALCPRRGVKAKAAR
jgi:endonuclease-3